MSNPRIKNGRFITKKKGARNVRAIAAMSTAKKEKIQELLSEQNKDRVKIGEGSRIVQLKYLAKNLKCLKCKSLLDLEKVTQEKRFGLHSVLDIKCDQCDFLNSVHTGKIENNVSHINAGVILGKSFL